MRIVKCSDVAEQIRGVSYKKGDVEEEPFENAIPVLRAGNIDDDSGNLIFEDLYYLDKSAFKQSKKMLAGDILVAASSGSIDVVGKAALYKNEQESTFGAFCKTIRPDKEKINSKYLFYFFRSKSYRRKIKELAQGANINNIKNEHLDDLEIPLPTLDEQKAIVAKLDRAQRLIDIDKEMLAKYDELIQSVFLEMFGDPVTNPKGLPKRKIKEIGEVVTGNTPPKKNPENYGSEIEWVKTTNIIEEQLYPTAAEEYLSNKGKEIGRIIPKNSLIVCSIAGSLSSIGKCSIVDREIAINQQINAIVPHSEVVDTTFLYTQLLVGKKLIQDASTKSMKGMVSKSKFQKIKLLVPDINSQLEFSTIFKKIGEEKLNLRSVSKKSEELFSALVQKAFGS